MVCAQTVFQKAELDRCARRGLTFDSAVHNGRRGSCARWGVNLFYTRHTPCHSHGLPDVITQEVGLVRQCCCPGVIRHQPSQLGHVVVCKGGWREQQQTSALFLAEMMGHEARAQGKRRAAKLLCWQCL